VEALPLTEDCTACGDRAIPRSENGADLGLESIRVNGEIILPRRRDGVIAKNDRGNAAPRKMHH
jgi:hypothetical protein